MNDDEKPRPTLPLRRDQAAATLGATVESANPLFLEVAQLVGLGRTQAVEVLGLYVAKVGATPLSFSEADLVAVAGELRRLQDVLVPAPLRPNLRAALEERIFQAARRQEGEG